MAIKHKFQCSIFLKEHGVNLYSDYDGIKADVIRGNFIPFIPGYRSSNKPVQSNLDMVYIPYPSFKIKLTNDNRKLIVWGPEDEIEKAQTIPYLIHFLTEQLRQQNDQFTIRGAAVSKNGKAILLIGKRGSGKTSVALELCRKYGYSLIGNDIVLIGQDDKGIYFLDGTKIMTLRFATVKNHNQDLQKFFKGKKWQDEWITKINLLPEQLDIKEENKKTYISKAIYLHLFDDHKTPLFVKKHPDLYMGRLFLYEELSRYIRGTCIPAFVGEKPDLSDYLQSIDKPFYHKKRKKIIDHIVDKIKLEYVSGSMKKICRYLDRDI